MYAIAKQLTAEAKAAILSHDYPPTFRDGMSPLPRANVNGERCCPLSVGLRAMFPDKRITNAPDSYEVANVLGGRTYFIARDPIEIAAERFIVAWDKGRIANLATALGVRP